MSDMAWGIVGYGVAAAVMMLAARLLGSWADRQWKRRRVAGKSQR